jgi:transcriptional regulator with XRE-family HTH domain
LAGVTPEAIRRLREELHYTEAELARALGVESAQVHAWERAEQFPTRRWVAAMERLRAADRREEPPPPDRDAGNVAAGLAALARPELWELVRKLAAYPELFERARELASGYDDPVADD